jgi:hypothetical protein
VLVVRREGDEVRPYVVAGKDDLVAGGVELDDEVVLGDLVRCIPSCW